MASEVIFTEFVVTRVLHTARISNVESTVCDNEERKMVNVKLGKKEERWNIRMFLRVCFKNLEEVILICNDFLRKCNTQP